MQTIHSQLEIKNLAKKIHNGFLMVKFYADWCTPCKSMNPIYDELANDPQMSKVSNFIQINRDDNMDLIIDMNFDFMSIPRFFIIKVTDGNIVDKKDLGGSQTKSNLTEQIKVIAN